MTPEPEPEPEPITQVTVVVKVQNTTGSSHSYDVVYNYENNPDPYTATRSVSTGDTWTLDGLTYPVGSKILVKQSNKTTGGEYTLTDASSTVEVTFNNYVNQVYSVTDNLSRTVWTFGEVENDGNDELKH